MSLTRSSDARPGVRVGIAIGMVGVAFLVAAFAVDGHAAGGAPVASGEPFVVSGARPVHVVGVVEPGSDARAPTTCTVASASGSETIDVGTRQEALEGVRVGRRLRAADGERATVVCDRRVAVATGPIVLAYPLARAGVLHGLYAALALLGFAYARRRSRSPATGPRPGVESPVQPGDDESRSEVRSFAADVVLQGARAATGVSAILLGLVGLLVLREGSPLALILLILAGLLGAAAGMLSRWRRRQAKQEPDPPA